MLTCDSPILTLLKFNFMKVKHFAIHGAWKHYYIIFFIEVETYMFTRPLYFVLITFVVCCFVEKFNQQL